MDKHYVEKMGAELSLLGLGCMRFPVTEGTKIDREKAQEIADRLIAAGVNYFDTGYPYHGGDSEVWLSEGIVGRYPRDSFYIADKLLMRYIKKPEDMDVMFAEQLDRLKVDYIDFYLLHNIQVSEWNDIGPEKIKEFIKDKLDSGKIRKIGFSFHSTPEDMKFLLDQYDWDFVQIQYNFYDETEQRAGELYDLIEQHGAACVVMEPVRGGGLANLPDDINKIFKDHNPTASVPSWCFRWVAGHPNVAVVLSGMSDLAQAEDNIKTFTDFKPLDAAEQAVLQKANEAIKALPTVPCTACKYCVDGCPMSIKIPDIFEVYNDFVRFAKPSYPRYYNEVTDGKDENLCISCGACVAVCPQHIDIPEALARADKAAAEARK